MLWDLITATRGQSIRGEQPGRRRDPSRTGLHALALPRHLSRSTARPAHRVRRDPGNGYSSTIQLIVDGIDLGPRCQCCTGTVSTELDLLDLRGLWWPHPVVTGDGVAGARLRTGRSVSANYRSGSAPPAAPATTLTPEPCRRRPILAASATRSPAGGGADPDLPSLLREYAPTARC